MVIILLSDSWLSTISTIISVILGLDPGIF